MGDARASASERRDERRSDYPHVLAIPTRWADNDQYGHVNNVTYYAYFDTVVNEHLVRCGGLDTANDPVVGFVVETSCTFHRPVGFPDVLDAAMRVARLGTSSVVYEIAIFGRQEEAPAATGRFVHVWVDRASNRPAPVPERVRAALAGLVVRP